MNEEAQLLSLSIVGCREAAATGCRDRAMAELEFSNTVAHALCEPVEHRGALLRAGLRALREFGGGSTDGVLASRRDTYSRLVDSADHNQSWNWGKASPEFCTLVLGAVRVGQDFIGSALTRRDCVRAEIEAEHIHNLPELVFPEYAPTLNYYMETERHYYLERLEKSFGTGEKELAASHFSEFWSKLSAMLARN